MSPLPPLGWRALLAVAAGGAIGATCRWGVDVIVRDAAQPLAIATWVVNVVGCLLMGLLVAAVVSDPGRHPLWRPFLGVGVLGGFTTFSAFALDSVLLLRDGSVAWALAYVAASLAGSLVGVWGGFELGHAVRRARAS